MAVYTTGYREILMGETARYPIEDGYPGVTGRDGYIIAKALYLACTSAEKEPGEFFTQLDRKGMLKILQVAFPDLLETFRAQDEEPAASRE